TGLTTPALISGGGSGAYEDQRPTAGQHISDLATLLGGHFALEWYEGVAIVREVADRLLSSPGDRLLVPELNQIRLSSEGHVEIVGGAPSNEPVRRLGQ